MNRMLLALALSTGCVSASVIGSTLREATARVDALPVATARDCAPRDLALAQAHLDFARLEARQGRPRRVGEHAESARQAADRAHRAVQACAPPPEAPAIVDLRDCTEPTDPSTPVDARGCALADPGATAQPTTDRDGDGVPDSRDFCPDTPEDRDDWEDEDGCPDLDNDGDGIPDSDDACPIQPGDAERGGCPVRDRDRDGIPDEIDRCPDQPETVNDYLDQDGCPDAAPAGLRVHDDRIELIEPIRFEPNTATLTQDQGALSDLVRMLREAPGVRVQIQSHTELLPQGDALSLSRARAEAVVDHLTTAGVARDRLEAEGYGAERPVDTNRTQAGRDRNRRIELVILPASSH